MSGVKKGMSPVNSSIQAAAPALAGWLAGGAGSAAASLLGGEGLISTRGVPAAACELRCPCKDKESVKMVRELSSPMVAKPRASTDEGGGSGALSAQLAGWPELVKGVATHPVRSVDLAPRSTREEALWPDLRSQRANPSWSSKRTWGGGSDD